MAGLTRVPAPRSPFDGRSAVSADCSWSSSSRSPSNRGAAPGPPAAPTPSPYRLRERPRLPRPSRGRRSSGPTAPSRSDPRRAGRRSIRRSTPGQAVPSVGLAEPTDIASGPGRRPRARRRPGRHRHQRPGRGRAGHDPAVAVRRRGRPERQDLARLAAPWADVAGLGRRAACTRRRGGPGRGAGNRACTAWTCSSSRPGRSAW